MMGGLIETMTRFRGNLVFGDKLHSLGPSRSLSVILMAGTRAQRRSAHFEFDEFCMMQFVRVV